MSEKPLTLHLHAPDRTSYYTGGSEATGLTRRMLPWITLFLVLLCWRGYLILEMPIVFSWDAFTRLWEKDQIVVRHWLPLSQLPVYFWGKTNFDLEVLRLVYATIGSTAALSAGWYVSRLTGDARTGILSAALVGVSPIFVKYTIVPYQEGFFLLFTFVGITLWAQQRGGCNHARLTGYVAGVCLMLAVLSRYEGWVLVGILATSSIWSKRFSELRYLGLASGAMLWWTLTSSARSSLDGPPRGDAALIQLSISTERFTEVVVAGVRVAGQLMRIFATDLLVVGLVGVGWGLWVGVVERRSRGTRELAVLLIALLALTTIRALNAGVLTDRMTMLPTVLGLVFFGIAWQRVNERLGEKGTYRLALLIPTIMLVTFAAQSFVGVRSEVQRFQPEANAARVLESLPPEARVKIEPREIRNILSESAVGAIFAQTTMLDAADPRLWYEGQAAARNGHADFRLYWAYHEYIVQRLDSP